MLRRLSLLVTLSLAGWAHAFDSVVVFGDSLSDIGNTNVVTFGIRPGSGYWNGRFSNGPVWAEPFAAKYGFTLKHSKAGGTDYAYGGAETGTGNTSFVIPNMRSQVTQYLSAKTPTASTLIVLWGGGNDYLNGQTNINTPVNNLGTMVTTLYNAGARQFLVPNLPLLGNVPQNRGTSSQASLNTLSANHNTALKNKLASLKSTYPAITFYTMDIQGLFTSIQNEPSTYGFVNATNSAMGTSADPATYAFWDGLHPTTKAHQLLATKMILTKYRRSNEFGDEAVALMANSH